MVAQHGWRAMTSPQPPEILTDFWRGAHGAVAP
jgi:hypothetical protein